MRKYISVALIIIIPLGFYTKFYTGPFANWVNNSLSGILYEIFWCLLIHLLFPKARIIVIAVSVLIVTSILEFFQLWHPPILESIRKTFIGRTIIGTSFTLSDFFYYIVGCLIGFFLMLFFKRAGNERDSNFVDT